MSFYALILFILLFIFENYKSYMTNVFLSLISTSDIGRILVPFKKSYIFLIRNNFFERLTSLVLVNMLYVK